MWRYLKAAFWWRVPLRGLGSVPANAVAALGFGILGLGHPAFWLLGAGLEAGYLGLVAAHPRFQRLVDRELRGPSGDATAATSDLLNPAANARLTALERKCTRALDRFRERRSDDLSDLEMGDNRDALERLTALYRQLLASRCELETTRNEVSEAELQGRVATLERSLADDGTPAGLRDSQAATLKLLRQRLAYRGRGEALLREIDSDLERIENQVDLTLESAGLPGRDDLAAANLELASRILESRIELSPSLPLTSAREPESSIADRGKARAPEGR